MLTLFKKEKLITSIFFIFAFTIAVLCFSLSISVVNSYNDKLKRFDINKNKLIKMSDENVTYKELKESVEKNEVTVKITTNIFTEGGKYEYTIATYLNSKGIDTLGDLRTGKKLTGEEYVGSENIGLFSTGLTNENSFIVKLADKKTEVQVIEKGKTFEGNKAIIVPIDLFFKITGVDEVSKEGYNIIVSGENDELASAIYNIETLVKSKNNKGEVVTLGVLVGDRRKEAKILLTSTIIVVLITLLNSTSLSRLWVENKKKELVMRKVCGAKNKDIFKLFYKEMLQLAGISTALAILMQLGISTVTNGVLFNLDIRLGFNNCFLSILVGVIVSLIVSLPALRYISKVQPIEMLREE